MTDAFRQVEYGRTIAFGPLAQSTDLIGTGYTLLTTPRAAAAAAAIAAAASAVVEVPDGFVDEVAGALRPSVTGTRLVALGGGRVIDVAKAVAAADPPRELVAIPTSLSGAEMTRLHRHAAGVPADTPRVRPHVVVNDPALSASQPADQLAASSANALAHATVGLLSDLATPISRAVATEAIVRIAAAWARAEPDRPQLALGALLAGWAVDASGLGPHHAMAQTAVRLAGVGHGQANAALLPATIAALRARRPEAPEQLETVAASLRDRAGAHIPADDDLIERMVQAVLGRPELGRVAPAPDAGELRAIYRAAQPS